MSETYYRAVTQILIAYGCYMDRQGKGSHEIWYSPIVKRKFVVAYTIPSKQMANICLKQAGIKEKL